MPSKTSEFLFCIHSKKQKRVRDQSALFKINKHFSRVVCQLSQPIPNGSDPQSVDFCNVNRQKEIAATVHHFLNATQSRE